MKVLFLGNIMKKLLYILIILVLPIIGKACTDIVVGKKASKDGSIMVSHTGCGPDCRVHVIHGRKYKEGEMTPVYYGLQDASKPFGTYGKIIGYIPQARETYTYFHSAYSHMNEFQLSIAESTLSQRKEMQFGIEDNPKQIMTIEQAQAFALQRCKTAREALKLITSLVEKYGFLPSCGPESESLCIADKNEVWILEVFSVGKDWSPKSGKLGAIWAAQRVPDDHVAIIPNWSVIKEIREGDSNFMYSSNYKQVAIDMGWYNPSSGRPFNWQKAYSPIPREWAMGRFWLFFKTFAPYLKDLPDRSLKNAFAGMDPYHQFVEDIDMYPFSIKPSEKVSVKDIIAFQRSTFEGTIYDMTADPDWYVPSADGKLIKSPLTTPFPSKDLRELLDINYRRNVSKGGYGMVCQIRNWLPDAIGGIYWFYVDNQYVSTYVPIYAGVQNIADCYKHYNPNKFERNSIRWSVDFVDNLMGLRWQEAVKDLRAVRDPLENSFFDNQEMVDKRAYKLYTKSPRKAKKYLTDLTHKRMNQVMKMYNDLRFELITKYTNNN